MMTKPRIGLYGVLEKSEQGWEKSRLLLNTVKKELSQQGLIAVLSPHLVIDEKTALDTGRFLSAQNIDVLLAVIVTWSFDNLTLTIQKQINRPLAVLAVPGICNGSLVGAQQMGSLLTDLGIPYESFFGAPDKPATYQSLAAYARAALAQRLLRSGKIAFIGRRTPGMTPIAFDEVEIARLFGTQIVTFGWDEIEQAARRIREERVKKQVKKLQALAGAIKSTSESLADASRLYLALRDLAKQENFITLALGCYPHYAGHACVACGLLGDDNIPASCEGDLNSGLAMCLLQTFTGQPVHFGEMLDINEKDNSLLTSHCGSCPTRLACDKADIQITPVRLFEKGACLRFPAKGGPITYVNLVGRRTNYRLCAIEGTAEKTKMVFEGNPVKIKLNVPVRTLLDVVSEKGFGHHWMMGYGHVERELKYFCKMTGVEGTFIK